MPPSDELSELERVELCAALGHAAREVGFDVETLKSFIERPIGPPAGQAATRAEYDRVAPRFEALKRLEKRFNCPAGVVEDVVEDEDGD